MSRLRYERPLKRQVQTENHQLERNTLGSALLGGHETWKAISQIVQADDFGNPLLREYYEAMLALDGRGELFGENDTPDTTLIHKEIQRQNKNAKDGQILSHTLMNDTPNYLNGRKYAIEMVENAIERSITAAAFDLGQGFATSEETLAIVAALEMRRASLYAGDGLPGVMASDVRREPIHWLWSGHLARGKAAMIDGEPGLGKGLSTIDIVARLTTGRPMPGEAIAAPATNVVMLTSEDDAADTIGPRLDAAGADTSRVRILTTITTTDEKGKQREDLFTLPRNVPDLERIIRADEAALLIIDPVMACLDARVKTGIDSEVRGALMPLVMMLRRTGCACIMVRHLNKSSDARAIYRGGGSIAFTGIVRTSFLVAEHPDAEGKRVLASVKSNISKLAHALAFSIVDGDPPHIEWCVEQVDYSADSLLAARKSDERRALVRVLAEAKGPMTIQEIADAAECENNDALRQRLSRMVKAGEIRAISRGVYASKNTSQVSHRESVSHLSQVSQTDFVTSSQDMSQTADPLKPEFKQHVTLVPDVTGANGAQPTELFAARMRRYLSQGMTLQQAEERALADIKLEAS